MALLMKMLRKRLAFVLAAILAMGTVTGVQLWWNAQLAGIIDTVSTGNPPEIRAISLALVTMLAMGAAMYLGSYLSGSACERMTHDLRMGYARHFSSLPVAEIEQLNAGEQLSKLQNEIADVSAYLDSNLFRLLGDCVSFIATFTWLLILNARLTLTVNLPALLIIVYVLYSSKAISGLTVRSQEARGRINRHVDTLLTVFPIVRLYDAQSNRKTLTVTGAEAYTVNYQYDLNNRLLESKKVEGLNVATTNYFYDPNGNTISTAIEILTPAAGAGPAELSLDGSGYELSTYNGFNQLVKTYKDGVTTTYAYKPNGLRASKTTGGVPTTHVWDGANIVLDVFGGSTTKYIRGIVLIYSDDGVGRKYFNHNAHGDVVQLVGTSGLLLWTYRYDAFGVEQNPQSGDTNVWRYCGEYFDRETGTVYLRNRIYNPVTGRFTQEDPIGAGLNWYTYCYNNPIIFVDPWGLDVYIFYLPEWLNEALEDQKWAMEFFGLSEDEVQLLKLTCIQDFLDGWDEMAIKVAKGEITLDAIIINTHATPLSLAGKDSSGNWWYITANEIKDLANVDVGMLIIYGCNAGHFDYVGTNIASLFAEKVNGAPVLASDGTIISNWTFFGLFKRQYQSANDRHFQKWVADKAQERENKGWIIYQKINSKLITSISQGKFLTTTQMFKILSITPSIQTISTYNNSTLSTK